MDIGWPTNVRHIAHVTFDRFNGFSGLPVELELEVPRRVPSASVSVFGVSSESMQCSFDGRGNSVPTILLLLQERLYEQGGLQAEGIFRINPENSQEEQVRDHLNKGIVPYDIDVHCLAGLIKAWFRELPKGVLDTLTPEQVMECHTEDRCIAIIQTLPPTEAALLNWAVNLMADVVQEERFNKMNARNVAMVFAPNMTQMSDPLTALMHAVQVMNLLKNLIVRTIKDREKYDLPSTSKREPQEEDDSGSEFDSSGTKMRNDGYSIKEDNEAYDKFGTPNGSKQMAIIKEKRDEDEVSLESQGPFSSGSRSSTWDNIDVNLRMVDDPNKNDEMDGTTVKPPCLYNGTNELNSGRKTLGFVEHTTSDTKSFARCPVPKSVRSKGKAKVVEEIKQQNGRVEAWQTSDNNNVRLGYYDNVHTEKIEMLSHTMSSNVTVKTTIGHEIKRTRKQVKRQLHYHFPLEV